MAKCLRICFIVLLILLAPSATMFGSGCSGNACGALSRADRNGCIIYKNNSDRTIQIQVGPYGGYIKPNGQFVLAVGGKCVGAVIGDVTANYVN